MGTCCRTRDYAVKIQETMEVFLSSNHQSALQCMYAATCKYLYKRFKRALETNVLQPEGCMTRQRALKSDRVYAVVGECCSGNERHRRALTSREEESQKDKSLNAGGDWIRAHEPGNLRNV